MFYEQWIIMEQFLHVWNPNTYELINYANLNIKKISIYKIKLLIEKYILNQQN